MNIQEIASYIARSPERVVKEVKEKNCVLNNPVKSCPDLKELEPFVVYHYWSNSESVNVFLVSGTAHPDYSSEISWIDLLIRGKRMPLNLRLLEENPGYYFETEKKEPVMHYVKVGDEIFVGRDGNHRTAIAKVFFYYTGHTTIHGIEFEEYGVDLELKRKVEYLRSLLFSKVPHVEVRVLKQCLRREDAPSWKKDYFKLSVELVNYRKNRQIVVDSEELDGIIREFENWNLWRKFFGKGKLSSFLK